MGFEIFVPLRRADSVKPSECSLTGSGLLKLHAADLHRAGIKDRAAVLIDKATGRVAFRAPLDSEPYVRVRLNKGKTAGDVGLHGAIKVLGLDAVKARGRRGVVQKDNLLIVQFR